MKDTQAQERLEGKCLLKPNTKEKMLERYKVTKVKYAKALKELKDR